MAGKDIIAMSQKELRRLHVIHKAIDRVITQLEAAEIIGGGQERQLRGVATPLEFCKKSRKAKNI